MSEITETAETIDEQAVKRRSFLRGSALVAGAAGAAAAAAVINPTPAQAADGDTVKMGQANSSGGNTTLSVNGTTGGPNPTLRLQNQAGPALEMEPLPDNWTGQMALGQMAMTPYGPVVGVNYQGTVDGEEETYLATGIDLYSLASAIPTPVPIPPVRLIDTRVATDRAKVIRSSASPFEAAAPYRLKAGAWIDVVVDSATQDVALDAAFLNITAVTPTRNGYLTAYPPGARPATSTVNYATGQIISNAAFTALGVVSGKFVVRIFSYAPSHVIVDLTGVISRTVPVNATSAPSAGRAASLAQRALTLLTRRVSTGR